MKRILFSLGMVLLCALLFAGISTVVLMVAPGTEIFGIRYVSLMAGNGTADITPNISADQWLNIQNIEIETGTAPIIIERNNVSAGEVHFYQSFVGFTKDDIEAPTLEYSIDAETNTLKLKTAELNKFGIATNECYLKVSLPGGLSKVETISITSKKSPLTIQGESKITLQNLNVKGNSGITFSIKEMSVQNINVSQTISSLTIPSSVTVGGNVTYETTVGNLKIESAIGGDINANTTAGMIYFNSCKNFTANTDAGSVRSVSSDVKNQVYGNFYFTTALGDCEVYQIHGTEAVVKTQYGKVNIEHVPTLTINAEHGQINVNHVQRAIVTSSTSTMNFPYVENSIYITTTYGTIHLGDEDGSVSNVDISTKSSKITIQNAIGFVKVNASANAKVVLQNKSANNIYIATAGDVSAKGLVGNVQIYTFGMLYAEFESVDSATIVAKDESVDVKIMQNQDVKYKLQTDKNMTVERDLESLEEIRKLSKSYVDEAYDSAAHKLYIRAQGAIVDIYKKTA